MRILKMRASFGKLHGELALQEGMNLLTLPNEEGKSTWSAFLLAMLYGIETRERSSASNGGLPAKDRYRPWNGEPMEGSIELEWKGKYITIERSSTPKAPMSVFRAFDTKSGRAIEVLTGENCGRILCGVERSVFERTAFIRQMGISISGDSALEKRLGAMVSTGEESAKSAQQLEKELQGLKNRLSGRAGKITKLQTELTETERLHSYVTKLREDMEAMEGRRKELEEETNRLEALLQRIDRAKDARGQIALQDLEKKLREQESLCINLEQLTGKLPTEATLHKLNKRLEAVGDALETAKIEAAFAPPLSTGPTPPPCFKDMTPEQAGSKVKEDLARYEALSSAKLPKKNTVLGLSLLLLFGAVILSVLSYLDKVPGLPFPLCLGLAIGSLLLFGVLLLILNYGSKKVYKGYLEAKEILENYGVESISRISELLEDYEEEHRAYEQQLSEESQRSRLLREQMMREQEKANRLMEEIRAFDPDAKNVEDGKRTVSEALEALECLSTERRVLEQQRGQYDRMKELFGKGEHPMDYEALNMDEEKLRYEYREARKKLADLSEKLSEQRGRMEASGNIHGLDEHKDTLRRELASAKKELQSIELAAEVLHAADDRVRSRFSPRITAEAGKLLSRLTRGKYPSVQLSPEMQLSVRDGVLQRPAAAMSCGTVDQMYLALRLAMCHLLLPKSAPLILDDALVNFDDDRCAAALELLKEEAENRQVILFSCRSL